MKILTVDDDAITLEMLNLSLQEAGYETQSASNGQEAMEILRGGACRIVITDWEMPVMNGLDLCRAIRREDFPSYVYTIILTSHATSEEVVEGLTAGADDFLTKPFNPAELTVRIRTAERILSLETRDMAIFAMAKLAESRDPGTGHHLERIGTCCRVLGERLQACSRDGYQIDGAALDVLCAASALHDIGKVGIPDRILLKPGPLAEDEWAVMRTHTTLGAETLRAVDRQHPGNALVRAGIDIAEAHHEWWNGQGYPRGLTGEAIPLFARIVAVADMYDALTSDRPYRSALEHGRAVELIVTAAGQQLDPVLVDAFEATGERLHQLGARLRDGCGAPAAAGIPGGRSGESKGSLR